MSRERRGRTSFARRLGASWINRAALVWLALLLVAAVRPTLLQNKNPRVQYTDEFFLPYQASPPDGEFWLGTTGTSFDIYSRVVEGARPALISVLIAVSIAGFVGVSIGLVTGYVGGRFDRVVMWFVDAIFAIPTIMIALTIVAVLTPSLTNAAIAIGVVGATRVARLTRSATVSERHQLYVEGARIAGISGRRIVTRHIFPNIVPVVTVELSLLASATVVVAAALSFLGVTGAIGQPAWGSDLVDAQQWLRMSSWDIGLISVPGWVAIPPGVAIVLTALSFNFLGDGIRDAIAADRSGSPSSRRTSARRRPTDPTATPESSESVDDAALLTVRDLSVTFPSGSGDVHVIEGVSFSIDLGETLGLVGESGSGKSMTAFSLLGMTAEPGWVSAGSVQFRGRQISTLGEDALGEIRGRDIALVFQEATAALNPTRRIGDQIAEPMTVHRGLSRESAQRATIELLTRVGVPDAERRARQYPHEFSGGMAQRAVIARALSASPKLLICDEPTTALDVTIQGQVLDLLRDMQAESGMAMLFITHDLGVVAEMCDRVAVMYAGQIVEIGRAVDVFERPRHAYTQALLGTSPEAHRADGPLAVIPGQVPPPTAWPSGCRFHPRCAHAIDACREGAPQLVEIEPGHSSRCVRADDLSYEHDVPVDIAHRRVVTDL